MSQDGKRERKLNHSDDQTSQKDHSRHQNQERRRATLLWSCIWMIIIGVVLGVLLYAFQILPAPVLRFAVAAAAVIAVLGVVIGLIIEPTAIRHYFSNTWQNANKTLSVCAGLIAVIVIFGGSYLFSSLSFPFGPPLVSQTPTPGNSVTPIPTHGAAWASILKQTSPCNNPPSAEWNVHTGGTNYTCYSSGGVMQQKTSSYYAEMDLIKVNGSYYNQTNFRVQDDIAFQDPNDPSTWAALTVQSPADIHVAGGYIFTLSPSGAWTLQQVVSAQSIPTVGQGSANINPHQVVHMMVIVRNNVLSAYINVQQVFTTPDSLSTSPSVVGLIVERQNAAPSALVEFSNFELDKAG